MAHGWIIEFYLQQGEPVSLSLTHEVDFTEDLSPNVFEDENRNLVRHAGQSTLEAVVPKVSVGPGDGEVPLTLQFVRDILVDYSEGTEGMFSLLIFS